MPSRSILPERSLEEWSLLGGQLRDMKRGKHAGWEAVLTVLRHQLDAAMRIATAPTETSHDSRLIEIGKKIAYERATMILRDVAAELRRAVPDFDEEL